MNTAFLIFGLILGIALIFYLLLGMFSAVPVVVINKKGKDCITRIWVYDKYKVQILKSIQNTLDIEVD